jgi:hypothetical protein
MQHGMRHASKPQAFYFPALPSSHDNEIRIRFRGPFRNGRFRSSHRHCISRAIPNPPELLYHIIDELTGRLNGLFVHAICRLDPYRPQERKESHG